MQADVDALFKKNMIFFNNKTLILFVLTSIFVFSLAGGSLFLLEKIYQWEWVRADREANLALEAFEKHTIQVVKQVDVILRSIRMTYQSTGSAGKTEKFIEGLNFTSVIENVFLLGSDGSFIIPDNEKTRSMNVLERHYYKYHKSHFEDDLFISPVEKGIVTGVYYFRISRRINHPDGSFGGVVLATVNPNSFTRYFQALEIGPQNVAALVGTLDKKYRARIPESTPQAWNVLFEASLWETIEHEKKGSFKYVSKLDHVNRDYRYKKVGDLPLVMLVGFSDEDVKYRILERKIWLVGVVVLFILFAIMIVLILLKVIKTNAILKAEIAERNLVQAALEESLAQVKLLEGIFPICSYCKKIRNDKGYWEQVDTYISRHSEALFSSSICPECLRKNYPHLAEDVIRKLNNNQ